MTEKYLIQIGESVHASIPRVGARMKELVNNGLDNFDQPSEARDYIINLITEQVDNGADYIAVNVDDFAEQGEELALNLMRRFVGMVREHSKGVPVCVDSSNPAILKAGWECWYDGASADIAKPLINSVTTRTMYEILPLNKEKPFKVVALLVDEEGAGAEATAETMHAMARKMFAVARENGFEPDDIFFDTTTYPLSIDLPMTPGTPSFTYRAFNAIKAIKQDPELKGVHCSLGISNCVKDLPARKIGICRAYVAKAREYGLDAGIVNVMHHYGSKEAAPELQEMVDAFANQDGSEEASMNAMMLMGKFCRDNKK